ncbi:MAG: hypothetical protein ACLSHF_09570 [[Eubacterium] siraeum]|jgi:hypothetical protein
MHITTENKKEYLISEVLELDHDAYADYRNRMRNLPDSVKSEYDPGVEHLFLLVVGDGYKDGVIVDFSGRAYEGIPAFADNVRSQLENHIRRLADYCVREGTEHTEDGKWSVSYDELYYHFDSTTITSRNGMGRLLWEELQQREEINELIMTEDCIEMTYHMEYCENCQEGGIKGAMSLFSLMGCNLYDVHLCDSDEDHELATVVELNQDTLTEDGRREWSDVLSARVTSIYEGAFGVQIGLTGCPAERLRDFSFMLAGHCSAKEYERWVKQDGKEYAAAKEQSQLESDTRYSADLVATYEELMKVPGEEQITAYFGDYGLHHFKYGVTEKQIHPVYDKALAAIEMTEDEFNARHSQFVYRGEIIGRMRDCLLPSVLKTGEEYLFVATEPYGGDGDFALRGGILLGVDTDRKTCTMRGDFFTMEDVPLRYILARHNPEAAGKHYGFAKAEPLFGEYPALAQQYLKDAEEAFHEKWNSDQEQDEEPAQSM